MKRHKTLDEVQNEIGNNELIEEKRCLKCGGILVTIFGYGISCTFCVDCGNSDCIYD